VPPGLVCEVLDAVDVRGVLKNSVAAWRSTRTGSAAAPANREYSGYLWLSPQPGLSHDFSVLFFKIERAYFPAP
jgi:hypothetical protein